MGLDLERLAVVTPTHWLRRVPGRETFLWPEGEAPEYVVKRSAGSDWRERWFERLHGQRARSPARREYENLNELAAAGFSVPRAIACFEPPAEGVARSLVVMQYVAHRLNLRERIEREPGFDWRPWVPLVLATVVELHRGGWYHRDFYLQHFLALDEPRRLVLLDVGRTRRQRAPRERWFEKDLAALLHSTPEAVPRWTRLRFLVAYARARGLRGGRAPRRLARAVESRRAAMASHRPRHGEGGAA